MLEILGGMPRGIDRPHRDHLHLHGVLVEAVYEVFVGPVDDFGIAWIGQYETGLTIGGVVPVMLSDRSLMSHAGDGNARIVLLGAVGVVGKAGVHRDVVELGS